MPLGRLDRAVSHPLVERGGLASGGSPAALPMAVSWPCSPTKTESLKADSALPQGGCWGDMWRMLGGCFFFFFSSIFDAGADKPWARTSQLGGMRCSGSAEVRLRLMGPLPGWHDWKRIGHFVS